MVEYPDEGYQEVFLKPDIAIRRARKIFLDMLRDEQPRAPLRVDVVEAHMNPVPQDQLSRDLASLKIDRGAKPPARGRGVLLWIAGLAGALALFG